MELILVRHSITQGNLERRFIGRTDQPLVPQGEQLAARRAAGIPAVEHVFVSPLQRCRRTADILWPHVEHTVLEGLRETDFGDWEGMSGDELEAHPRFQAWLAQGCEGDLPTMETREQCAARAGRALEQIIAYGRANGLATVGVATHGGTLMAMLWAFAQPERQYHDWLTPNCGGWRVRVGEGERFLTLIAPLEPL